MHPSLLPSNEQRSSFYAPGETDVETRVQKSTWLPQRISLGGTDVGGPSTDIPRAPACSPGISLQEYIRLDRYLDWQADVNEYRSHLITREEDLKARLHYQEEMTRDMTDQIDLLEHDLLATHDVAITASAEARTAKFQSRAGNVVAVVVMVVCVLIHLYH
ncbi:hypothetical protein L1987_15046 [Smallanthus sonchifolius]|uniref:Uncharacterized protein n=1 Tax=Smallanthus sonchifolius TaxID=185202 RepID=A0ACB9J6I3_9ASTR|nr:hypothetical protein L1987_15046 [Smallanthus sonchifolius]